MATVAELRLRFPDIPWREPLPVSGDRVKGLACRICIANDGLKSEDIVELPQTQIEFDDHMKRLHPEN